MKTPHKQLELAWVLVNNYFACRCALANQFQFFLPVMILKNFPLLIVCEYCIYMDLWGLKSINISVVAGTLFQLQIQ